MEENNPFIDFPRENKKPNLIIELLQSVVIAISISVFLYVFILTPNEVDGTSMQPNFETGDLLFTSKLHQWFNGTNVGDTLNMNYKRGDVIVFQETGMEDFVKRIIGMPGEYIRINEGTIYINEKPLKEKFEIFNSEKNDGAFLKDGAPSKIIPEDSYIVLGDHRNVSYDSRNLGFIEKDLIKGRVSFRFWPLDKFGFIPTGEFEINE